MSGAAGHIMHLHEADHMRVCDMIEMVRDVASNRIIATEKIDGINVVVGYDRVRRCLRVARNLTHLRSGGLSITALAMSFGGRRNMCDAIVDSMHALEYAFRCVSDDIINSVLVQAHDATSWLSVDVVSDTVCNVIRYSSSMVVVHSTVATVDGSSIVWRHDDNVSALCDALCQHGDNAWCIGGPRRVVFDADVACVSRLHHALMMLIERLGLEQRSTIGDIVSQIATQLLPQRIVRYFDARSMLPDAIKRILGVPGAMTQMQLCKHASPAIVALLRQVVRDGDIARRAREPLELALCAFAAEMLHGQRSAYVDDHVFEIERISHAVDDAVDALRSRNDRYINNVIDTNANKLRLVGGVSSSLEGVVFAYHDMTYKLTGAFAPVNQLLGLRKYGRGRVTPSMPPRIGA